MTQGLRRARARRRGVTVDEKTQLGRGITWDVRPPGSLVLKEAVIGDGARFHVVDGAVTVTKATLGEGVVVLCRDEVVVGEGARVGDHTVLVDFRHARDDVERPARHQPLVTKAIRIPAGARIGPMSVVE